MKACKLPGCAMPIVGALGADALIVKPCVTLGEAALKFALPNWLAVIEQAPAATNVTLAPATVQNEGVVDANVTVRPEVAVAVSASGDTLNAWLAIGPKVIVWFAVFTTSVNG